jgi:hypothetical protein
VAYGGQSWLSGGPLILFFPPCGCEPAMLEEGVSDHRHKRMSVKALPGSSLEVVKTKIGHCHHDGSTYLSQMVDSARLLSLRLRTRLSDRSSCPRLKTRRDDDMGRYMNLNGSRL